MKPERTDAIAKMVGIKSGIIFDSKNRCWITLHPVDCINTVIIPPPIYLNFISTKNFFRACMNVLTMTNVI